MTNAEVRRAHLHFARGEKEAGIALLAAQAPHYAQMDKVAFSDETLARDALACAVCGGDAQLASRILTLRSAGAAGVAFRCGPTANLTAWCAQNGAPISLIEPPCDVGLPATTGYSQPFSYRTDPILFVALAGAEWVPGWDFVVAPDGTVLDGSGYLPLKTAMSTLPHFHVEGADLAVYPYPERYEEIDADVLFLSAPTHANFGHWTIDFLPRLRGLDLVDVPNLKIAVPEDLGRKRFDTLALWGIRDEQLLRCRRDTRYRFRTLHVLVPGASMPHPNPSNVDFVRARHDPMTLNPALRTGPQRIFLARTGIGTRLIANAAEFEALLAQEGFVSKDMADLSIAEQRQLLSNADVLLGVAGTNMLALYFAPVGCNVISLLQRTDIDPPIAQTAAVLGMYHQFFVCAPAEDRGLSTHAKDTDIVVDCAELKRRLDEIANA
jgi:capsular polysaccharide biosynthesis protein